ncbi:hypothetical protein TNCV_4795281 [Trichonephila clavipes]|nr:hypothetical protein TNCV_4795281 [Trichonephila clavipes]
MNKQVVDSYPSAAKDLPCIVANIYVQSVEIQSHYVGGNGSFESDIPDQMSPTRPRFKIARFVDNKRRSERSINNTSTTDVFRSIRTRNMTK